MTFARVDAGPVAPDPGTHDLAPVERLALAFARFCNATPSVKRLSHLINLNVTYRLVRLFAASRVRVLGLERLVRVDATRGILFAPNHRSFFDLYLVMAAMEPLVRRSRRMYFPVRSNFWYDSLFGIAMNALTSSMSMYPPIFRESQKRSVTLRGLDFLARELETPGVLAGMHPEGTRNRGLDPYALLPAEQSFGRVVLTAKPSVVPVFINGVGNSLSKECVEALRGRAQPIVVVFGAPLKLDEFAGCDPTRLRYQIEIGRRTLKAIEGLAAEERAYRASLAEGAPTS